ncbi:MAG: energy transducer TonB [Candidatus Sulfotelmatobacter sp.]|jgi:TonB family protein
MLEVQVTKISRFPLLCILFNLALFVASNSTAQSAQGGFKDSANSPNAATRVEAVEILGDDHGAALRSYVETTVLPLVRANWYRLASKSGEAGGDATVELTILKDGNLAGTKLTGGAGHATLGDLAQNAVTKSAPFPAPPAEFTAPSLSVRARFVYQPVASLQSSSGEKQSSLTPRFGAGGGIHSGTTDGGPISVDGVDEPVYRIRNSGIRPPRAISRVDPEFTEEARKKNVSGTVAISFVVTSKGDVTAVRVNRSLGSGLDEKAIEAVRQWKFEPATKDGEPVAVQMDALMSFNLYENGKRRP